MPHLPLISIVTPSYQQGDTIEQTIESVLDQDYPRFEHIVIDGGSTDGTVAVLERYPHLQWASEPDRGQTHAINKGLARAQGEVFAYLNSDDLYRPGCFALVAEAFANPACQVLVGDCDLIDAQGLVIGHDAAQLDDPALLGCYWRWGAGVLVPQPAVFIRKSLLDEAGPFDESYDMAMDLEMWLRLARRTPFTLLPQTLAGFRVTPQSKTSRRPAEMIEESRRAALAHQEIVPAPQRPAFVREVERQTVGHLLSIAEQRGDRGIAWKALRRQPSALFSRRMLRALLMAVLLAVPAAAWGPVGHRVVGMIAEERMSPQARRAVTEILDGQSLADAATWADEIRSDPNWEHAAPWHYVNIADGETYETSRKDPRGDVIEAIARFRGALLNARSSRRQKAEAVRFLAHFVGDIHQPLHVGRKQDLGGNSIKVRWYGRDSNLHRVWDSDLIRQMGLSSKQLAVSLGREARRSADQWLRDGVLDWVGESLRYRAQIYDFRGGNLGKAYFERHRAMVRQRLQQAGVRLAALFDGIFGS